MKTTFRITLAILLSYILQTSVLPRVLTLDIQPDIMLATLVVLTLNGDRYRGFCAGACVGLLMDAMIGTLPVLYLLTYPLVGYAAATISPQLFMRLPEPKRFKKLVTPKLFAQFIPMVTAALLSTVFEIVLMVYRYLNSVDVTFFLISRMLRATLYTAIATFFIQYIVQFVMTISFRRAAGETSRFNA